MKIKISKLDAKFSHYVRWIRDKGVCQRCKTQYHPPTSGLHCSHFHGRAAKSTRFNLDNVASLCHGCHAYFHGHPVQHYEFFMKRLGEHKFQCLDLFANTPTKVDYGVIELWLDNEIRRSDVDILGRKA